MAGMVVVAERPASGKVPKGDYLSHAPAVSPGEGTKCVSVSVYCRPPPPDSYAVHTRVFHLGLPGPGMPRRTQNQAFAPLYSGRLQIKGA